MAGPQDPSDRRSTDGPLDGPYGPLRVEGRLVRLEGQIADVKADVAELAGEVRSLANRPSWAVATFIGCSTALNVGLAVALASHVH